MGHQYHKIAQHIPTDRFISRAELVKITGYTDRHVRGLIEEARRAGFRIVSNTGTGGYKMAADGKEWGEFVERERKRAIATFKRTTGIPDGQISLVEGET